ncbi:hypothetical protein Cgig2_014234 [Carnegiea gigantea]|uniref:Uncharacterized protein n=1 Tax=Carnegiea gigantea TaxID=171969 RepID=A0A9Q1K0W7_9CARY|nr:hypothetical protein Cgig2_014234 [Carnegiea gigantea]
MTNLSSCSFAIMFVIQVGGNISIFLIEEIAYYYDLRQDVQQKDEEVRSDEVADEDASDKSIAGASTHEKEEITKLPLIYCTRAHELTYEGMLFSYLLRFSTEGPPFELRKKGRPEKHKKRESIAVMQLQGRLIYGSGTKRCKNRKQLGHNSLTYGKPSDANGNLIQKYKRKPNHKKGNQVERPTKVPKIKHATTAAATSVTPTQSSQAHYQ